MKKKYYLTLDTETATLPFANEIAKNPKQKQKIAIAKPLVYDIGWVITDRLGNRVKRVNYLIQETFFVPAIFNTAYYRNKRPIYEQLLAEGKIGVRNWNDMVAELLEDLEMCTCTCAYNAAFDYKKAIPFTEQYISHLYAPGYQYWEDKQRMSCKKIVRGFKDDRESNPEYLEPVFKLRDFEFPIVDLWAVACERLINIDKYRNFCLDNSLITNSGEFFKSSAETSFQYLNKKYDFTEDHTALSDSEIEADILTKALKKGKVEPTLKAFPFRELGTTYDYVINKRPKSIPVVIEAFNNYLSQQMTHNSYVSKIEGLMLMLEGYC